MEEDHLNINIVSVLVACYACLYTIYSMEMCNTITIYLRCNLRGAKVLTKKYLFVFGLGHLVLFIRRCNPARFDSEMTKKFVVLSTYAS